MIRRGDHRGRYPITLDPAAVRALLITTNTDALALHYPGPDGLCPLCGQRLCAIRLGAIRALRAEGVKVTVLPPHEPMRPQWWCEACDCPWPCSQARVTLGDWWEEDRAGLATHMGELLVIAARDLPATPADELNSRFVAWVV